MFGHHLLCMWPIVFMLRWMSEKWNLNRFITKPTKRYVRPAKTQISLGIRPVWSDSSLSAWRKRWTLVTHWVHSEDWSNWADAQADLSLIWAHFVGFVMRKLIYFLKEAHLAKDIESPGIIQHLLYFLVLSQIFVHCCHPAILKC